MSELNGMHCLITGGSGGIGQAIARTLASHGASITVHYNKNEETAKLVASEINQNGGQANIVSGDLSVAEAAKEVVEQAYATVGQLDILVNCAGMTKNKLVADLEENDWLQVMKANLGSVISCTQAASKYMLGGGAIINVSSIMSLGGWRGNVAYSMSKAAIDSFTRTAAIEYARFGLRINAVLPGFAETELISDLLKNDSASGIINQIPTRRPVPPEQLAELVAFIARPTNTELTGSMITIDGASAAALLLGHADSKKKHVR